MVLDTEKIVHSAECFAHMNLNQEKPGENFNLILSLTRPCVYTVQDVRSIGKRSRKDAELDSGPFSGLPKHPPTTLIACQHSKCDSYTEETPKADANLASFLKNCKEMNNLDL